MINQQSADGSTALHYAVKNDHVEVADLLLERGANASIRDMHGKTPAQYARSHAMKALFQDKEDFEKCQDDLKSGDALKMK